MAKKTGRPSIYSDELVDSICALLSEGKSMKSVCAMDGMPSMQTAWRWLRENDVFREKYTMAKQESADALVDEMLDIADDGTNDWMTGKESEGWKVNGEHVQRSRLRVETRKWISAKLKPKKYGDKMVSELVGKDGAELKAGNILNISAGMSPEQIEALARGLGVISEEKYETD
jgi:hypothetical protein